jgi:hypothetical protein
VGDGHGFALPREETCRDFARSEDPIWQGLGGILFANRNEGQRAGFNRERADFLRQFKEAVAAPRWKNLPSGENWRWQPEYRRMTITDWLNFTMLLCAAIGSMAFGILAAYAILRAGFALIRPHPRSAPVEAQPEAARTL